MSSFEYKDRTVLKNIKAKDKELLNALEKRVAHFCERASLLADNFSASGEGDQSVLYEGFADLELNNDSGVKEITEENEKEVKFALAVNSLKALI